MSKIPTLTLSRSRDIPFNKLLLSQANVRRTKAGVSIEELAEDIARRTLLQSLSVRPVLDAGGAETGMFEIPAGGRRYRALERLVKQKRLARNALIPCVIRTDGLAEEDSLAENIQRAPNQIEKAYGPNNSILDNCHLRVSFATNDERTAKRVSDALGVATELRAMRNYAGHRLSPWLGHLMVSRQETARPLLTPGEIMQLPATDEIVMVSGAPPVRATKARYYEDRQLKSRILPAPDPAKIQGKPLFADDWSAREPLRPPGPSGAGAPGSPPAQSVADTDADNAGVRREPALPDHEDIVPATRPYQAEFEFETPDEDDDLAQRADLQRRMSGVARQVAMDPSDDMEL
jgi:type IV secretion system protein VirD4